MIANIHHPKIKTKRDDLKVVSKIPQLDR